MSEHSGEAKAAVVAALLSGQSIDQVANEYHIPRSTVGRWKKEGIPASGTQKKEIGDLILEYLEANLITLKKQMVMFGNTEWLAKQNAADIAVLHGVMTDKAIRLLEAMSKEQ